MGMIMHTLFRQNGLAVLATDKQPDKGGARRECMLCRDGLAVLPALDQDGHPDGWGIFRGGYTGDAKQHWILVQAGFATEALAERRAKRLLGF